MGAWRWILSSLVTIVSAHGMQGIQRSRKSQAPLCCKRLTVQLGRGDLRATLSASGKLKMVALSSSSRGHWSEPKLRPPDTACICIFIFVHMCIKVHTFNPGHFLASQPSLLSEFPATNVVFFTYWDIAPVPQPQILSFPASASHCKIIGTCLHACLAIVIC